MTDVATEEGVTTGAHVADLVQISLYLRTTGPSENRRGPVAVSFEEQPDPCDDVLDTASSIEAKN
jgi:hypothetical protein